MKYRLRDALILIAVVALSLYGGMRIERSRQGPSSRGYTVMRSVSTKTRERLIVARPVGGQPSTIVGPSIEARPK